ncbi:unnamed protein product [Linum trigynum]|uniref:Uncharacterized protein n=1 Tax=Linum trigynum TaxID=586398 RepID=A0AAV2FDQ6_9ROSI
MECVKKSRRSSSSFSSFPNANNIDPHHNPVAASKRSRKDSTYQVQKTLTTEDPLSPLHFHLQASITASFSSACSHIQAFLSSSFFRFLNPLSPPTMKFPLAVVACWWLRRKRLEQRAGIGNRGFSTTVAGAKEERKNGGGWANIRFGGVVAGETCGGRWWLGGFI